MMQYKLFLTRALAMRYNCKPDVFCGRLSTSCLPKVSAVNTAVRRDAAL